MSFIVSTCYLPQTNLLSHYYHSFVAYASENLIREAAKWRDWFLMFSRPWLAVRTGVIMKTFTAKPPPPTLLFWILIINGRASSRVTDTGEPCRCPLVSANTTKLQFQFLQSRRRKRRRTRIWMAAWVEEWSFSGRAEPRACVYQVEIRDYEDRTTTFSFKTKQINGGPTASFFFSWTGLFLQRNGL